MSNPLKFCNLANLSHLVLQSEGHRGGGATVNTTEVERRLKTKSESQVLLQESLFI